MCILEYPNKNWWTEVLNNDYAEHNVICPICLDYSGINKKCVFCEQDTDNFSDYCINVELLIKNLNKFKALKDSEIFHIINDLSKETHDCLECSCMEDEDYYCTSCEGQTVSELHRLIMILVEEKHEIDFAKKISNLKEAYYV